MDSGAGASTPRAGEKSKKLPKRVRNEDINLYAVLNVSRTATPEEIRASYKRLSRLYHPNLQAHNRGPNAAENGVAATEKWTQVQMAYETLTDDRKRAIYDMYGIEGLSVDWDLGTDVTSTEQVKERLREQAEKRSGSQYDAHIQRTSEFIMKLSCVENSGGPLALSRAQRWYWPETVGMRIAHGVEARVTPVDTVAFQALIRSDRFEPGGQGGCAATWEHRLSPRTSAGVALHTNGMVSTVGLQAKRHISESTRGIISGGLMTNGLSELVVGVDQDLPGDCLGSVRVAAGGLPRCTVSVSKENDAGVAFDVSLNAPGLDSLVASIGAEYSLTKRTTLEARLSLPLTEMDEGDVSLRLGARRFITKMTQLGTFVKVHPLQLAMGISLSRQGHTLSLPIAITDDVTARAVGWAVGTPTVVWMLVRWLLIEPRRRVRKREKLEKRRQENAESVARARREAEADINLMHNTVRRKQDQEVVKDGLIIIFARYGNLAEVVDLDEDEAIASPFVTDVEVPLQVLVSDSRLVLQDTTKADLIGFHDPCPGEDKQLHVRYLFKGAVHEVTINDDEPLQLPLRSHLLTVAEEE